MTKSQLLTELVHQKVFDILRNSLSVEDLLNDLMYNDIHLENLQGTCCFNGKYIRFTSDYPEMQSKLDLDIDISEATEFFKHTLNEIYYNDNLSKQLSGV